MQTNGDALDLIQTFSGPKREWVHTHMQADLISLVLPIMLLGDNDPVFNGLIGKSPWWNRGVSPWVTACCSGLSLFYGGLAMSMEPYEICLSMDVIRLHKFFQGIARLNKFSDKVALEFCKHITSDFAHGGMDNGGFGNHLADIWGERLTFNFAADIQQMNNRGYDYFVKDIATSCSISSLVLFGPSSS